MGKNTLILGATTNETRYAYTAADMLVEKGHEIFPFYLSICPMNYISLTRSLFS